MIRFARPTLAAAAATLALCLPTPHAAAAEAVAVPPVLDEMSAIVVVGDVHGLTEAAAALARNAMPGVTGDQVRQMAGAPLGDPGLEGMKPGAGAAMLIPPRGGMVMYLEVTPEKIEAYEKVFRGPAMRVAREEGMLLLADGDAVMEAGKKLAPEVKAKLLGAEREPVVRVDVRLGRVLADQKDRIDAAVKQMAESMGQMKPPAGVETSSDPKATGRMMAVQADVLLEMGRKIETVSLTMAPSAKGLDMEARLVPAGGMGERTTTATVAQYRKLLPMKGAMRLAATLDAKTFYGTFGETMRHAMQALEMTPEQTSATVTMLTEWGGIMGDGFAMDYIDTSTSPTRGAYVFAVTDGERAIEMFTRFPEMYRESGLGGIMGPRQKFDISFEKNVREADGVPVHLMRTKFEGFTAAEQEMMLAILGSTDFEVAVLDGKLLYSVGPGTMESLVKAVRAGADSESRPMQAEALGQNPVFVCDYEVGRLAALGMSGSRAALPAEARTAMDAMAKAMESAPGIAIAAFRDADAYRIRLNVPAGLVSAVASGARAAAMSAPPSGPADAAKEAEAAKKQE